jgi:hypothetical protein
MGAAVVRLPAEATPPRLDVRQPDVPAADFDRLIGELVMAPMSGGCGHCDAEMTVWQISDDDTTITHITVAHDPDCPAHARIRRRRERRAAMGRTRRRGWSK